MKSVLLISAFLIIACAGIAQNSGYTYEPFGHHTSYEQGYYYTTTGEKVSGLIKWECSAYSQDIGANYILFKPAQGEKKIRLTTTDVKAFVIEKDSFTIIKSFSRSDMTHYSKDFARVVVTGYMTLYIHCQETKASSPGYGSSSTGMECFYFIKKDGALYRLKRKEFKDRANFIFGDNAELMNKINQKVLSFDNLEQIVAEYNAWKAKQ